MVTLCSKARCFNAVIRIYQIFDGAYPSRVVHYAPEACLAPQNQTFRKIHVKLFRFKIMYRSAISRENLWIYEIGTKIIKLKITCVDGHKSQIFFSGARLLSGRVTDSGARGQGFDTCLRRVVSLSKNKLTPRKVLVIPRKRWLCPDMTGKLLTGTLSIITIKQTKSWFLISGLLKLRLINYPSAMCAISRHMTRKRAKITRGVSRDYTRLPVSTTSRPVSLTVVPVSEFPARWQRMAAGTWRTGDRLQIAIPTQLLKF